MATDLDPFFIPSGSVSPGGKAAIALKVDGVIVTSCIGSGENFREAKACALRNLRCVLGRVIAMQAPDE